MNEISVHVHIKLHLLPTQEDWSHGSLLYKIFWVVCINWMLWCYKAPSFTSKIVLVYYSLPVHGKWLSVDPAEYHSPIWLACNGRLPLQPERPLKIPSQHGLTLTSIWIGNYNHYHVFYEIMYPFLNFNSCTVEVWNEKIISSHTLVGMWLLIHGVGGGVGWGVKVNPC